MDAIRISDGSFVVLKQFLQEDNPDEEAVHRMMGMGELVSDPGNHCIPLHEVLDVPNEPGLRLLVMPFACPIDYPRWDTVGEAVECIRQIIEVRAHLVCIDQTLTCVLGCFLYA